MFSAIRDWWRAFRVKKPEMSKFVMFFLVSNGITLLQLSLMPLFRWGFEAFTDLANVGFQALPVGSNVDGSPFYVFDYAAGPLPAGGGGLAYFLAVQITLLIAQVLNFFLQRNVTFRSNTSVWVAAAWYAAAYVAITFAAAAAQGLYKAPIYDLLMNVWGWGATGEVLADVITMTIASAISFWVFYPIFKIIFRQQPENAAATLEAAR